MSLDFQDFLGSLGRALGIQVGQASPGGLPELLLSPEAALKSPGGGWHQSLLLSREFHWLFLVSTCKKEEEGSRFGQGRS